MYVGVLIVWLVATITRTRTNITKKNGLTGSNERKRQLKKKRKEENQLRNLEHHIYSYPSQM